MRSQYPDPLIRPFATGVLAFAMIALAAVLLAMPAGARTPATGGDYSTTLVVGSTQVRWQTPQASSQILWLSLSVRGRDMRYVRTSPCTAVAVGGGILVSLNGCGRGPQHLRLTAASVNPRPVRLKFAYGWR